MTISKNMITHHKSGVQARTDARRVAWERAKAAYDRRIENEYLKTNGRTNPDSYARARWTCSGSHIKDSEGNRVAPPTYGSAQWWLDTYGS